MHPADLRTPSVHCIQVSLPPPTPDTKKLYTLVPTLRRPPKNKINRALNIAPREILRPRMTIKRILIPLQRTRIKTLARPRSTQRHRLPTRSCRVRNIHVIHFKIGARDEERGG